VSHSLSLLLLLCTIKNVKISQLIVHAVLVLTKIANQRLQETNNIKQNVFNVTDNTQKIVACTSRM